MADPLVLVDVVVPPPPIGSREHLQRAIDAATTALWHGEPDAQRAVAVRAQLRASATAYVRALRTDGVSRGQMLERVHSAVRDTVPPWTDTARTEELAADLIPWSTDAYDDAGRTGRSHRPVALSDA